MHLHYRSLYWRIGLGFIVCIATVLAIQGSVLFLSVVFVAVNLLTDIAYAKADPRVAYE